MPRDVLAHAGDQEDLVVHGQAESHADEEDRHERQQRAGARDEAPQAVLPYQHRQAEGAANRKQEAQARHQWHQEGAEDNEQ